MKKNPVIAISIVGAALSFLLVCLPQVTRAVAKADPLDEYRNAKSAEQKLEKIKDLGIDLIDRRLDSLDQLKTILDKAVKLTPSVKESLITKIAGNITDLRALKTEIQAGTDFDSVREQVRSITTGYRIYAVFMPQIRGLAVVDRLRAYQEKLDALKVGLQAKANAAKAAGRTVDDIQKKIDRATAALSDGASLLTDAERDFITMKIDNPAVAHDLFKGGKEAMQNARESFNQAKNLLREAVNGLREIE